ncbi:MAG: FtsW/RodA/SpoVE family cell cycle protein [Mobilitalea sp.]
MGQFDKKENYLELIKNQIRCKKAKDIVLEEIDHHIEDQKAAYLLDDGDENIAMDKALEQMGDPIEVGKQLDKIHKPRVEWYILLFVLALCCIGILAQFSIRNTIEVSKFSYGIDVVKHILFVITGFLLMIVVYFLDYSIIGKYPKVIWFLLLAGIFLYAPFGNRVNGHLFYLHAYGMLFFPVFGGILYAFRNKGYVGMIKCILFSITAIMTEVVFEAQFSVYLGLQLSSLIMLSVAIMKNWFGTSKKISLTIIWGWIPIAFFMTTLSGIGLLRSYQVERLQSFVGIMLHPELYEKGYQSNLARQVISHAKLFGQSIDFTIGFPINLTNDYILTFAIRRWGIVAGTLIIGLFITFIVRMIYISLKQKNPLGMFVGLGCSLVFAAQGSIYILSNLGYQPIAQVNLPFVSYGGAGLVANFIVLGIMLSVFRNTNIMKEVPYKKKFSIHIERVK